MRTHPVNKLCIMPNVLEKTWDKVGPNQCLLLFQSACIGLIMLCAFACSMLSAMSNNFVAQQHCSILISLS